MSYDSLPDYEEKAPTFDDVVAYAVEAGLFGKVSLTKFYEYYADFKGPGGMIIDWKTKLHEWASRQKGKVVITASEYNARNKLGVKQEAEKPKSYGIDADLINELDADLKKWGVTA